MARSRIIKPGFFFNEYLGKCDPLESILFIGLWTLADREGRIEFRPDRIIAQIFPYRREINFPIFSVMLRNLSEAGQIICYTHENDHFIAIPTFKKHQLIHKNEKHSTLPQPPAKTELWTCTEKIGTGSDKIGSSTVYYWVSGCQDIQKIKTSVPTPDALVAGEKTATDARANSDQSKNSTPRKPKVKKYSAAHERLAAWMADAIRTEFPHQQIKLDDWANAIRLLIETDKISESRLRQLWIWIRHHRTDDFSWADNCRSPLKLRQRKDGLPYFDIIERQMQTERTKLNVKINSNGEAAQEYLTGAKRNDW